MTRTRAVGLVIHENALLVMFRKNTREYYVFPGGGVDEGESIEAAVVREIKEETSIDIEVGKLAYVLNHDNGDTHYYYLSRYIEGEPRILEGTNEYADNQSGKDYYDPQWLPLDKLADTTIYPLEARDQLVSDIANGFSDQPIVFELKAI